MNNPAHTDMEEVNASTWRNQFAKDSGLVPISPMVKEYIVAKTRGGASLIKVSYIEYLKKWIVASGASGRHSVMDKDEGLFGSVSLWDNHGYDTAEEAIEAFYGFYGQPEEKL